MPGHCLAGLDPLAPSDLKIGDEHVSVCIECKSGCGHGGPAPYVSFEAISEEDSTCCDSITNVTVEDD